MSPFWSGRVRSDPSTPAPAQADDGPRSPATGPWDVADPDVPQVAYIDLGALRLPARQDLKLRLDVDKNTQRVAAVTIQAEASTVQLTVFAAPRSSGVWDDVRADIGTAVTTAGGSVQEREGRFGTELVAQVPTELPDGRKVMQVQQFCGVDGPRWFVRAVFNGPDVLRSIGAQLPDELAGRARGEQLEDLVRNAVVVRGSAPMAPREPLELTLPEGARRAQPADQPTDQPAPDPDPASSEPEQT